MSDYTYLFRRFDSIGEFVKASNAARRESGASSKGGDGYGWSGTKDYETAVEYATRGGWEPEVASEFRNLFDAQMPKLRKFTEVSMDRVEEVTGDDINMQAFLDGEPECMFEWIPNEHQVTKHAYCIIIGHSISAGCSAEELFVRGQAAVALIRAMQQLGFELEVWSEQTVAPFGAGGRSSGERYSVLTRLHGAGEIFDESAVEYAVGNPAWLRRLIFGLEEGENDKVRGRYGFESHGGYGKPDGVHHADMVGADVTLNLGRGWFGEQEYNPDPEYVAEQGFSWVISQLKEIGVLPEDAEV